MKRRAGEDIAVVVVRAWLRAIVVVIVTLIVKVIVIVIIREK